MSLHPERDREPRRRRDAGFTLPELLIAVMISGILVVSISMAFTTVLRTQSQATDRLAESKDITFVQTWLPVDLSSALDTFSMPDEAELARRARCGRPPRWPINATLPGVNVMTVIRPDLEAGAGVYYLVAYRYHEVDGQWQLSRFEIRNPGTASRDRQDRRRGLRDARPAGRLGHHPARRVHAVEVTSRNQVILRPIGEDVKVNFESGNDVPHRWRRSVGREPAAHRLQRWLHRPERAAEPLWRPHGARDRHLRLGARRTAVASATEQAAVRLHRRLHRHPDHAVDQRLRPRGLRHDLGHVRRPAPWPGLDNGVACAVRLAAQPGPHRRHDEEAHHRPRQPRRQHGRAAAPIDQRPIATPTATGSCGTRLTARGTNWEDGLYNLICPVRRHALRRRAAQPRGVHHRRRAERGAHRRRVARAARATPPPRTQPPKWPTSCERRAPARSASWSATSRTTAPTSATSRTSSVRSSGTGRSTATARSTSATRPPPTSSRASSTSLGPILRSILIAECGGTLTVQKRIDTGSSLDEPAPRASGRTPPTSAFVSSTARRPRRSRSTTRSAPARSPSRSRSSRRPPPATSGTEPNAPPSGIPVASGQPECRRIAGCDRHRPSRPGRVLSDDLEARMSTSTHPHTEQRSTAEARDEGSVLPMILALMVVGSLGVARAADLRDHAVHATVRRSRFATRRSGPPSRR